MVKGMAKELIIGKKVIDMKVIGEMVLTKEKEFIIGKMLIDMREIGKMIL